jgi:hypothetical protein
MRNHRIISFAALLGLLPLTAFITSPARITVYLIGDSAMSIKEVKNYP